MLDADVTRRPACHALALLALAEAVGTYIEAEQAPSDGSITGDRDRAKRKVAARHDMYAKYLTLSALSGSGLALEAPCGTP